MEFGEAYPFTELISALVNDILAYLRGDVGAFLRARSDWPSLLVPFCHIDHGIFIDIMTQDTLWGYRCTLTEDLV